jgi:hypothetical protein
MFNMSKWLMLEMNRDEINKLFQDGMSGKLEQNHELLISVGLYLYLARSVCLLFISASLNCWK